MYTLYSDFWFVSNWDFSDVATLYLCYAKARKTSAAIIAMSYFCSTVVPRGGISRGRIRGWSGCFADRAFSGRSRALPSRNGGKIGTLGEQRAAQHRRFSLQHIVERAAALRSISRESNTGPREDGILHEDVAPFWPAVPGLRGAEALLSTANLVPFETVATVVALQQYYR